MTEEHVGQFTVAYPNNDKGKKMSPVKDIAGETWLVWKDKMAGIVPGAVVSCIYTYGDPGRDGKPTRFVKTINSIGGQTTPAPPAPAPVGAYTEANPPPVEDSLPHPYGPSDPPAAAPGGNIETAPILSNCLAAYLANPNCRFNFETAGEFGRFVRAVQVSYLAARSKDDEAPF